MKSIQEIALAALACGGTPTTISNADAEVVDQLEEEFGGPGGLMAFFDDAPDEMIADVLDSHDIGFLRQTLLAKQQGVLASLDKGASRQVRRSSSKAAR